MDAERRRLISQLYHAALQRPAGERHSFLASACGDDTRLREEVESLLANGGTTTARAVSPTRTGLREHSAPLVAGQTLGHYCIGERLGAGGMGVVYRARDTRLERDVAIKVLPAAALADQVDRARFRKEALALARLNHPYIGTIFDFNSVGGVDFLVMELVHGESLAQKIGARPLSETQVVALGIQIASALEDAHEQRIIHRDLKPGNILVTPKGQVKVLDFGLARFLRPEEDAEITASFSAPQAVAGTLPYMAPEQLRAQPADARTDIWALGVVLYEMAAGVRPFQGASGFELSAAILHESPPALPPRVAAPLREVIERCLEKDAGQRYQRAGEVRAALEIIRAGTSSPRVLPWRLTLAEWCWPRIAWPLAAFVVLLLGLFAWQETRRQPPEAPLLQVTALTTLPGIEQAPSLSPDGNYVVFGWTGPRQDAQNIYVQMVGSGSPLALTSDPQADYNPVWSPDGRWIAFLRSPPPAPTGLRSRELRVIPPLGGPERKLANLQSQDFFPFGLYLAWSADSTAVIVTDSPGEGQPDALFVVSLESGEKRRLTNPQPPVLADTSPAVAPDGRSLVFLRRTTWGAGELHLLPLGAGLTAGGEPRRLTSVEQRADYPAWTPDSREIVFAARRSLWRLAVADGAAPTPIAFMGEDGLTPAISRARPGEAARLVYARMFRDSNFWRIETSAPGAPATSPPVLAISSTRQDYHPRFSPDGRRVAFTSLRSGDAEIWVSAPDGSEAVKLTSTGALDTNCATWSPDGRLIAFSSNGEGEFDLYVVSAEGGRPRRLTTDPAIDLCPTFSRDGQWIYFSSMRSGDYRIWKMPAAGGDAVQVSPNQGGRSFESADGSLYYMSVGVEGSFWRLPAGGGEPVKLLDGLIWFNADLVGEGLYYIDRAAEEARLQYFNLATGRSTTVARNLGNVSAYLTASPDGRTILIARMDASTDDLMLVENFR